MSDDRDIYEKLGRPATLTPGQEFEMRQYREAGMSIKQCSTFFGVSITTVHRVLRKQRKMFGAEKLPNRQSARSDVARGVIQKAD